MRTSGILMPIFSLPGKYGIGCFSKEAYRFVDFLERAGQTYWQILPLGPTGYGDSPYQSFSTFAGNPYFISPETLIEKGWITKGDIKKICDESQFEDEVDYTQLEKSRMAILRKAFERVPLRGKKYIEFEKANIDWLEDYALFMALKDAHDGADFTTWEEPYRLHDAKALSAFKAKNRREVNFYKFIQYEFFLEWMDLKEYANSKGVKIIGDIPIYVAADSSDVWTDPKLFQMDKNFHPKSVAGYPPDCFSKTGQLWGNPLYDWRYHAKTGYKWWTRRFEKCLELYDVIRIDHFRGFDEYYSIPAGNPTSEFGTWVKGPGMALFRKLEKELGKMPIIAEDLGLMTDGVRKLVKDSGFPNMKIIQNAFADPFTRDENSETDEHIPYNYGKNCVVYTGTHDNDTLIGYIIKSGKRTRKNILRYLGVENDVTDDELADMLIRLAHSSPADFCIIPMGDYLHLDNTARINEPSTLGKNWKWRVDRSSLTKSLATDIKKLTQTYGRLRI